MKVTTTLLLLAAIGFSMHGLQATPGEDTFKAKCAACHGQDGGGNTPMGQRMKVRDLRSAEVQKQSDDELAGIIANGKPPMPGFAKSLDKTAIHNLVLYIRSIAQKG
jgi:mono/diheme cytochrome c family protein